MPSKVRAIEQIIEDPFAGRGLSPRQAEIAGMVARGQSIAEISDELMIAKNTVKKTLQNARYRLNLEPGQSLSALLIQQITAVLDRKGA
jgi:DNA-binding CsgD family transcriptional regulator